MSDIRAQMLGAVTPRIVGEKHVPTRDEVIVFDRESIIAEYCVGCGWRTNLALDHVNEYMREAGLPEQTANSLSGKYLQRNTCMMCAGVGDEPCFQILDIPRSS